MGTIIKKYRIFIFSLIILTIVIFAIKENKPRSALAQIYFRDHKYDLYHKIMGTIPESFSTRVKLEILEDEDKHSLLRIIDDRYSIKSIYYVLRVDKQEKFIKSDSFSLINAQIDSDAKLSEILSYTIDTEVFNEYTKLSGISHKEQVIEKYMFFLSNPHSNGHYEIIEHKSEIDSIVTYRPLETKENLEVVGSILDIETLTLDFSSDAVYCWFFNHGLVRFYFQINKGLEVEKVKSKELGFLGNECPIC